jgi:4-hydroxy-tetrahydrodipicolinate synthase
MKPASGLTGIWAAVLTPVDAALRPDAPKAIGYYGELLRDGCDGLNLLGTTGEAMSFSADERMRFMEAIAQSDLPLHRIMTGTGAASLADSALLTRRAFELGFAAALVMPPFFYREALDDGVVAFFDALLMRAWTPGGRVLLYNFPRMSGITFHAGLVDRLLAQFPEAIAGLKESSNDRRLQADVLTRHPELTVFPGSESYLLTAKAYGAAGCISGSVCLWPQLARDVLQSGSAQLMQQLCKRREALTGPPLIAAVRYLTAQARNDQEWERPMPPLQPLTAQEQRSLDDALLHVTRD